MVLGPLLTWIAVGAVVGAVLVRVWKTRGWTMAWGVIVGGAGGSAGGLIGRMVLPDSVLAAPIMGAVFGALVAMLSSRADTDVERPKTV